MAELFARETGCCRGMGGSLHVGDWSVGALPAIGIVGASIPISAGLAFAAVQPGEDRVVVCFTGDGATTEGDAHEGYNLAALWQLPVVYVCENNLYSISTRVERQARVTSGCRAGRAYGCPRRSWMATTCRGHLAVGAAVERARAEGPGRSSSASPIARAATSATTRRPIGRARRSRRGSRATHASGCAPPSTQPASCRSRRGRRRCREQPPRRGGRVRGASPLATGNARVTTIIEALRDGLTGEMERGRARLRDGRGHLHRGLVPSHAGSRRTLRAERILDTPVSEAGFVGLAIGAALAGSATRRRLPVRRLPAVRGRPGHPAGLQAAPDVRWPGVTCRSCCTRRQVPRDGAPSTPTPSRTSSTGCLA